MLEPLQSCFLADPSSLAGPSFSELANILPLIPSVAHIISGKLVSIVCNLTILFATLSTVLGVPLFA